MKDWHFWGLIAYAYLMGSIFSTGVKSLILFICFFLIIIITIVTMHYEQKLERLEFLIEKDYRRFVLRCLVDLVNNTNKKKQRGRNGNKKR